VWGGWWICVLRRARCWLGQSESNGVDVGKLFRVFSRIDLWHVVGSMKVQL
jgi:hypothetical protein